MSLCFLIFKYGGFLVIPLLSMSTLNTLYLDTDFNPLKMVKICCDPLCVYIREAYSVIY